MYGEFKNPIDELKNILQGIQETKWGFEHTLKEQRKEKGEPYTSSHERIKEKIKTLIQREAEYKKAIEILQKGTTRGE